MKYCKKCNTEKNEAEFRTFRNGLYPCCKQCSNKYSKEWQKRNDITIDWLMQLKKNTEICSLCGKNMIETSVYHPDQKNLDHIVPLCMGGKHTKNNVRYICRNCNLHRPKKRIEN